MTELYQAVERQKAVTSPWYFSPPLWSRPDRALSSVDLPELGGPSSRVMRPCADIHHHCSEMPRWRNDPHPSQGQGELHVGTRWRRSGYQTTGSANMRTGCSTPLISCRIWNGFLLANDTPAYASGACRHGFGQPAGILCFTWSRG